MNICQFIKEHAQLAWFTISTIVFSKLIEDNLPSLKFSNLKKGVTLVFKFTKMLVYGAVVLFFWIGFRRNYERADDATKLKLLAGLAVFIIIHLLQKQQKIKQQNS